MDVLSIAEMTTSTIDLHAGKTEHSAGTFHLIKKRVLGKTDKSVGEGIDSLLG
jgi:hypothetical protein